MAQASTDNVAGHRAKYDHLVSYLPLDEAKNLFVGGGDPFQTGLRELEVIQSVRPIYDVDIVDIGCGIGRLTQHLIGLPVSSYLGLDIIEEILDEARKVAADDARFSFAEPENCKIPAPDDTADMVVGFSLITHLLNEEILEYFWEARRVLRDGGTAVFSFSDLANETHRRNFEQHAKHHRLGHGDLLTYTTKETLSILGDIAGFKSILFPEDTKLGQSICVLR